MTDLSIIIISYNTKEITKKCLQTIIKSLSANKKLKIEIIVVDNNSNDGSYEFLKKFEKDMANSKNLIFKIFLNKKNLGYAKANNLAVKHAQSNYILFLNSDIEVLNNGISLLFNFYQQNERKIHFLGGKLFNKDLSPQMSCGPFYSLPVVFAALFLKGDHWGLTRWSPNKFKEVDWVSGACFITKKDHFKNLGGFDENIFMYMDEIDLFYRAKKIGFNIGFYPKAKFIHLGSASSKEKAQPIIQVFSGLLYFYKKHHNRSSQKILKIMLKLKAIIAIIFGKITKNHNLIYTYEKALLAVKKT